jgi:hypothetical protein
MSDISEGLNAFVDKFRAQTHESVNYLTVSCHACYSSMTLFPRVCPAIVLGVLTSLSIQEVATRFSDLDKRHADVCRDLERERVAARVTQQVTEKLEAELKELKEATVRATSHHLFAIIR